MELDQFCILAKSQKGRACAALIQQVIGSKKIFVFGELLSVPSVASLRESEEFIKHYDTLELFAYGTYAQYIADKSKYIDLSDLQVKKLKLLSLTSLASQNNVLSYETLQSQLGTNSIRELEDLIIEALYQGLVSGKLDQKTLTFKVKTFALRDVHPSDLPNIIETLELWKSSCKKGEQELENISRKMREARSDGILEQEAFQQAMKNIRNALKESMARGPEVKSTYQSISSWNFRNLREAYSK